MKCKVLLPVQLPKWPGLLTVYQTLTSQTQAFHDYSARVLAQGYSVLSVTITAYHLLVNFDRYKMIALKTQQDYPA